MTQTLLLLFALSMAMEVVAHVFFKVGVNAIPPDDPSLPPIRRLVHFFLGALRVPWLWGGIGVHLVELGVWLAILERAPLSLAFPIASLNYCGVILASRLWLGETVSARRWAGAGLITLGVAIVGTGVQG